MKRAMLEEVDVEVAKKNQWAWACYGLGPLLELQPIIQYYCESGVKIQFNTPTAMLQSGIGS